MRVLAVCTGNICRSPMVEHLLREGLAERGVTDIEVSSAGTTGLVGQPIQRYAAAALGAIDTSAFRARRLAQAQVAEADLVLAASRSHRAAAVTLHPPVASRAFTVRELDRLLSAVDPAALRDRRGALVEAAASQRGVVRPDRPEDDDVDDPFLGPAQGYVVCADLLRQSLARLVDLLAG